MIWYFKSNQKQNNRNRKEIKENKNKGREATWATYLALPAQPPEPAQFPQPAQPTSSSFVLFLLCQEDEQRRGVTLADAASATSCFPPSHLLLPLVALVPSATPRTPTPQASHSLPELLSSSGSLARSHRTHPPPPTSSLVATGHP